MLSEGVAGHAFLFRPGQLQYRFQIVVYGFRIVWPMVSGWHCISAYPSRPQAAIGPAEPWLTAEGDVTII